MIKAILGYVVLFLVFLCNVHAVEREELEDGLSFIIRAKNEEDNVRMCIESLLPLLDDDRVEIIFVDNLSTDNTYSIVHEYQANEKCDYDCDHPHHWKNIKIYKYEKALLRVGSEHQEEINNPNYSTVTDYYNWCLDKASKKNIIKWDADFIANIDVLQQLIERYHLLDRSDDVCIWCTGETLFIHKDMWFKKKNSYYDEFRVFSKYRGFMWENSPDGTMETTNGTYLQSLLSDYTEINEFQKLWDQEKYLFGISPDPQEVVQWLHGKGKSNLANKIYIPGENDYNKCYVFTGSGINFNSKSVKNVGCVPGLRDVYEHPVFYEIKRTNKDEFENRSDMIDERDNADFRIIKSLLKTNKSNEVKKFKINNFCIVIPSYNCKEWLIRCLQSVENQRYNKYRVCVIDDASTDKGHTELVKEFCKKNKWHCILNTTNRGALYNIRAGIKKIVKSNDDIIVTLDGDDWFSNEYALQILNMAYQDGVQLTYGRYSYYKNGGLGFSEKYPSHIIKNGSYRQYGWVASHLRTFKYKLWKKIADKDLRDVDGEYFKVTWDMAFMFPMLEMAGGNFKFLNYPLYIYNIENELSDSKLKEREQREVEEYIRNKRPYKPFK